MSLRKSAKGQNCLVRIPGVCSHDPSTVVLAHLNGGGMGTKTPDIEGAFACHKCHLILDGSKTHYTKDEVKLMHMEGAQRTREWWVKNGFITINNSAKL